jgi:hypothetical protein
VALSLGFRSFDHPACRRLGLLLWPLIVAFIAWRLSGVALVGVLAGLLWFFLPWLELILRVRHMVLPEERALRRKSPPAADFFPALRELTDDIEELGFEHVDDLGREWDDVTQFVRLFHNRSERTRAAICLVEQANMVFFYVALCSRDEFGVSWQTWNYPFSYDLKLAPLWQVNRRHPDCTFSELLGSHREFLEEHGIETGQLVLFEAEALSEEMQREQRDQLAHNLASGVIARGKDGAIRYTWRGLFFIWWQFIRDLVRFT